MEHDGGEGLPFIDPLERMERLGRQLLALSEHEDDFRQKASQIMEQLQSAAESSKRLNHELHAKQEALRNNMDMFAALKTGP